MRLIQIVLLTLFLVGLYIVALVWPGAMNGPMSYMEVNGPVAAEQLSVFWYTVVVSAFLMLVVGGVFLYAIFRFRAKPGQDFKVPEQTHGSAKLEVALIVASCLLLLVIAIPNAKALFYVNEVPAERKAEAIKVIAIGHQWWWEFQYPDLGITTANELHIPVGRPVDLEIKSVDVLHSFWVPRLAGKMDAVPGQINRMWMQADKVGSYQGHCTEYCGDSHANMRFLVMAEEAEGFDKWVANEKKDGAKPSAVEEVNGQRVFMKGCNSCHTIKGSGAMGVAGPELSHFGSRTSLGAGIFVNNDENLINWIKYPKKMKPGNLMNLEQVNMVVNDKDVRDLVAYLKSLK
ncbi:MAG: cytochrome c oxidase subunit II [Candidatus Melainabacteria bacterium HGW-Melainabacteria-1]|nr:MAG: cytochrome c oxidase subunit II [Candidatus Melainabacteria bacterium HGW-Melainabacteria-1]